MDQTKLVVADVSNEESLKQDAANDVRTLSELELVLCGGGDNQVNW